MKAIFAAIKRSPKLAALVAVVVVAVIVPASLLAWGPDRPTYTLAHPADHITFNSITDNPNIGDERGFVGIRETGTNNTWDDTMTIQQGKSYTVRMYVHNNAATDLNLVAHNVVAKFNLPTTTAKSIQVSGFLSADNASPQEVYDHATFVSDKDFNLVYQTGTLKYENNAFGPNGTALPESIFTSAGAKLGYDKLDGNIPGCFQYAGYVSFVVKPQVGGQSDFTVNKQVRKVGDTEWKKSIAANNGDNIEYQIGYKNTGETRQNNVLVQDTLPTGVDYQDGTTVLKNSAHTDWPTLSDNLTKPVGVNIADYMPGANAFVKFKATVNATDLICGPNTLTNKARVTVDGNYYKEDTADVVVNKTCAPGQINVCELATRKIVTINESDFDSSKYSKNLADCQSTPSELPQTGIDTSIVAFAGIGTLTAATMYAARSSRIRNLLRR